MKRLSDRVSYAWAMIFVVFSISACAASPSAGSKSTPQPPSPAVFVFVSSLNDQFDIHLGDSDGNLLKQLTNTPEQEQNTIFSPDGSQIAFCIRHSEKSELFVMNADGSGQHLLTDKIDNPHCGFDQQMAWSPDGKWISLFAWTWRKGVHGIDLFVVSADGEQVINLTESPGVTFGYAWNRDSQSLLVGMRPEGKANIFRIDLYVRQKVLLVNQPIYGKLSGMSPDGHQLLYYTVETKNSNSHIYSIPSSGGQPTQLTNASGSDTEPAWSSDGKHIVFTSTRDGNQEIYIMNADGSDQKNLTNNPEEGDSRPSLSPTGDKIIYQTFANEQWDSWKMNIDGSGKMKLTAVFKIPSYISWRP